MINTNILRISSRLILGHCTIGDMSGLNHALAMKMQLCVDELGDGKMELWLNEIGSEVK